MNKPLAIAYKPFSVMKANTSKERNFYTQGQQFIARVLFTVWLLASVSPEGTLAIPKRQMVPATTTSPGEPSLVSTPPTPLPGGILQLPPDSPGAFWGDSVASSPSIDAALQERMGQEAAPDEGSDLLRTSPKVSPVSEHFSFEAREGENVRFHYQMGQWRAEVSSYIGAFSRRAVLPVVCSQGEDIASSLEVLSKYPSWYSQRQIHVLDRNLCPTLGAVVYVGELGLKGGSGGEASGSGEQRDELPSGGLRSHPVRLESSLSVSSSVQGGVLDALSSQALSSTVASESQIPPSAQPLTSQEGGDTQSPVDRLKALASDLQIDQQPDKLAQLGAVLLKLAKAKQEESGASVEDLSPYTEAAILYQHVLSICAQEDAQKKKILASEKAKELADSAYQGLAQIEISMLEQATGAEAGAITPSKPLPARIEEDRNQVADLRERVKTRVDRLVRLRDEPGSSEGEYIGCTQELFEDIAKEIKSLLSLFYQAGEEELKAAGIERPCTYAIMGLGSIALQQTTPYSDLEFAILMEDAPDEATAEAWRTYFRKLTHLVHFRVINLGETVLPFSEYKISLDHLGRKGLNFDLGGKTPLGRKDKGYELIQPVEGMMEYLKNEGNKMEQMDKLLPFVLERTCHIYGDRRLHDSYRAAQDQFWSCQDAAGKHAYQERMRKVLLEGITELDQSQPGVVKAGRKQAGNLRTVGPKLHPEDAGRLYDVKQEIYRLPDRLLYGLATYYGLRPESAWDAVEQLKAQGIIGVSEEAKQASHRLQYAVSFATMLRLATYIRYGQQKETLSGSASRADSKQTVSELFALPKEALQEEGSLFKYYYTALALHSEMNGFFKVLHLRSQIQSDPELCHSFTDFSTGGKYTAGKEKEHFHSSGFYDTSCAAKIAIYHRLLHYEQAAKCAENHLKKVKAGYNKKKLARTHHNLGVSYYHLGKFAQSFDHLRDSLKLLEALYPDGDPQVAAVLRSLGIAHYNLSEFGESLDYFEQCLEMLQRLYQENNPETAQALSSVGAAHEQLQSFQESLQYKQQALKMLQALYPEKDPEVARARLSLADAYAATGQLGESQQHKEASLQMFKDLYGKSHPEVARALLSLGDTYATLKNFEASLAHKQEALEMLQALYGSAHPEVARARLSLGESYALSGKLQKSVDLKEESWKMFQGFYREDHPEVVRALGSLNETRGSLIQDAASSSQDTRHALRPLRTAHPQPLTLLTTPRYGKESPEENTLLRNYYRHENFVYVPSLFDGQHPKHVQDLHCQLMLLEQKLAEEDKEDEGDQEQAEGSSQESQIAFHQAGLQEDKTPIDPQDLFKDRSVHPDHPVQAVHRILLTGNPGTGKTTLSHQLAYQWAVGGWGQEFHTLYLLEVRNLQQSWYDGTRYNRDQTLATAIVNNCFSHDLPSIEADYNRLRQHIEQELKRSTTLVILDGLDERRGASEQILEQAQAGSHKLLMLSRPYGVDAERRLATIEVAHVGLNPEQLQAYLQAEVSDGEWAGALLEYIGKHEPIGKIAHVPGYLKILCEELNQGSLPGLYGRFSQLGFLFFWRVPAGYHRLEERPVSILARCPSSDLAERCKTLYQQRQDQPRDARAALTTQRPHSKWRSISLVSLITCLVASVPVLIVLYSKPQPRESPPPPPCNPASWDNCLDRDLALKKATESCLVKMSECSGLEAPSPSEPQRSASPLPCDLASWGQCLDLDLALEKATASCLLKMPECSELVKARQQLREYYQQEAFTLVPSLFEEHHSWHVQEFECQLMLLEQKLFEKEKEDEGDQEQAADSSEESQLDFHQVRLEEVKTPIGLQDLFKDRSVHPDQPVQAVQRILLTGDPGTGKTTLSKKLAYQWAVGAWGQEFKAVYLLPVRNLHQSWYDGTRYNRDQSLATAIVNICFANDLPTTEADYNRLREYIEQELKRSTTLVILNGLDERAGASKKILRQAQKRNVDQKLLMLSRPYGIDTERLLADIEIENVGFNDKQLQDYVHKEVSDVGLAEELRGYIYEHENIRAIAHVPVNLEILCALWQYDSYEEREELEQGSSLTDLYGRFTRYIWKRYVKEEKLPDRHADKVALFNALGQIALEALEQGQALIDFKLVDDVLDRAALDGELKDRLKKSGLLLLKSLDKDAAESRYEFPHLTFQEYFAGRTLAQQFLLQGEYDQYDQEEASDFVSEHKYESQYGQTLSFMAGEVSKIEKVKGIKKLLELLRERDKEIVGLQQLLLQLRVVHEWLFVADKKVEQGMQELEKDFQVRSSLEEWFKRAFAHVRLEGYGSPDYDTSYLPGRRLLALLKSSLQTFGSVARHSPGLLDLFNKTAQQDQEPIGAVRLASVRSLGGALAGVDDKALAMLQTMANDGYESWAIQRAANEIFSEAKGEDATQDETAVGGGAAQGSLGGATEATSQSPEALLEQLRQAAKNATKASDKDLRSARRSFVRAVAAAFQESQEKFGALLDLLLPAAKDRNGWVRAAAQEALWKAPLEELLAYYWSMPDFRLIPYIAPRLYHTPLVVSERVRSGNQRVSLYAAAGQVREWRKLQEGVLADFKRHVQDEVPQPIQVESKLSAHIDKSVWEHYFGAVGEEPAFPADIDIEAIMDSPCPFWEGRQVRDTHILALIPSHVGDDPLTLDYLKKLIQSPKRGGYGTKYRYYWDKVSKAIGNQSPGSSYWVLMTKDVLPESHSKRYEDQRKLVEEHAGLGYEVPGALEAAVVMLLHHVRSGERLYSDSPWTWTRCRDKDTDGYPVDVGDFSSGGLSVSYSYDYYFNIGVAGLRKF